MLASGQRKNRQSLLCTTPTEGQSTFLSSGMEKCLLGMLCSLSLTCYTHNFCLEVHRGDAQVHSQNKQCAPDQIRGGGIHVSQVPGMNNHGSCFGFCRSNQGWNRIPFPSICFVTFLNKMILPTFYSKNLTVIILMKRWHFSVLFVLSENRLLTNIYLQLKNGYKLV